MAEAVLGLVGGDASLRKGLPGLLHHVWQVVGVDMVEHVHRADCLLRIVTEHPLEGRIYVPQSAFWVYYLDNFRGVLHHREQPPSALRPMHMRRSIGVTRGTVTEVASVPIRGVHVSLSGGKITASVKYTARRRGVGLLWDSQRSAGVVCFEPSRT